MHLSILIPLFNWDVRALIQQLIVQRRPPNLQIELLLYDDGSSFAFRQINAELQNFPLVRYRELPQNIGRARIRNLMAKDAKGKYLLYLDCDAYPPNEYFLQKYLTKTQPKTVINGGVLYKSSPPPDTTHYLRWLYGRKREQKAAHIRNQKPQQSFHSFNFLVPRDIMLQNPFDESITQYGHEDTLFGLSLQARDIPILHIDNPAIHLGLEPAEAFLKKTEQAISNLLLIQKKHPHFNTRLLRAAQKHKNLPLPINTIISITEKQLISKKRPPLFLFDLYKWALTVKALRDNR